MRKVHVVFSGHVVDGATANYDLVRVTAGVFLDLDALKTLVLKASKNKSKRAVCGPLNIEVHHVERLK